MVLNLCKAILVLRADWDQGFGLKASFRQRVYRTTCHLMWNCRCPASLQSSSALIWSHVCFEAASPGFVFRLLFLRLCLSPELMQQLGTAFEAADRTFEKATNLTT